MQALVQIRFLDRAQQKHLVYIRVDLPKKRGQVISTKYAGNKGNTPKLQLTYHNEYQAY